MSPAATAPAPVAEEVLQAVARRIQRHSWIAHTVGGLITFAAIGFVVPVLLDRSDLWHLAVLNGVVLIIGFPVAGLALQVRQKQTMNAAVDWMREGRTPTAAEQQRALRLALYAVKYDALAWTAGGVLFAVVNGLAEGWELAAVTAASIWLGGETTSALDYLLRERALRPVTAVALAARPGARLAAPGVRQRLIGAWALGSGVPLLGLMVLGAIALTRGHVNADYLAEAVLFIGVAGSATGLLIAKTAARAIADPLTAVRRGLERVAEGDLDVHVPVDDGSEVGRLAAGFNQMAEGLRERERIRDLFGRQVGEDVAQAALRDGVRLGGEEREIGALFVDLVGSTSLALSMPPTEVVRILNRFFRVVVDVVEHHGGLVNKFEGDAALCVFGAPVPCDVPAAQALASARDLAERLAREVPEIDFGVGVSAGIAVAGNVGAERRFEYTVIGDPVNEAARLADLAKQHSERVLGSGAALDRAGVEDAAWELGEPALLRGRGAATRVAHPR